MPNFDLPSSEITFDERDWDMDALWNAYQHRSIRPSIAVVEELCDQSENSYDDFTLLGMAWIVLQLFCRREDDMLEAYENNIERAYADGNTGPVFLM